MNRLSSSVWIFTLAILSLVLVALFPTPATVGVAAFFVSFLVLVQVLVVLKDTAAPDLTAMEGYSPENQEGGR
ncbi:MAG: hypothetical protein R2795_01305 [Saprospiraceae bacterium]